MRPWRRGLKEGHLGKIQYATCFANKLRKSIGKRTEPLPIPETLDYELWCGPARKEPIYRDRIQYDCSFTWNMGDGESCNQGVHEVDIARWILGYKGLPPRTMSIGGRFAFGDAGEVPNTQIICYDYPEVPILYEVHNLPKNKEQMTPDKWKIAPDFRGARVGVCMQCEGGYTLGMTAFDNKGVKLQSLRPSGEPFREFYQGGAERQTRRPQRRDPRRPYLHVDLPRGEYLLPVGADGFAGRTTQAVRQPRSLARNAPAVRQLPRRHRRGSGHVDPWPLVGVRPGARMHQGKPESQPTRPRLLSRTICRAGSEDLKGEEEPLPSPACGRGAGGEGKV